MAESVAKRIQEIHSWEEVPDFVSESEEADYWATHGLAEDFFQSSPEMKVVLEEIQGLLDRLGECLDDVRDWEKYESDITAENLLRILRRDIEGVLCLANRDLRLLPPALVIARSIIETFGNLLWLIDSPKATKRGVNHLILIEHEIQQITIYIDNLKELQVPFENFENDIKLLKSYQKQIKQELKVDHNNKSISDFKQRLKNIHQEKFYPAYCRLSQSVHANHAATWIYKRDLGEGNGFGEIIEPRDWHTPLYICCYTLAVAGKKFLETFGKNPETFLNEEIDSKIENALKSLSKR
jgi:Family of unknown function (DUF5677)